ncbi:hypothetical protein L1887_47010 [Cichorium endivia]|nr:hypothetical protein L1887_47010 [Cichorium endivia]
MHLDITVFPPFPTILSAKCKEESELAGTGGPRKKRGGFTTSQERKKLVQHGKRNLSPRSRSLDRRSQCDLFVIISKQLSTLFPGGASLNAAGPASSRTNERLSTKGSKVALATIRRLRKTPSTSPAC